MILSFFHSGRAAIFFLILLLPGCMTQPGPGSRPPQYPPAATPGITSEGDEGRETPVISHEAPERDIQREPSVVDHATPKSDERRETVVIGGEAYSVPPPWLGNKIVAPRFDSSDFRRIPIAFTHNGGKVYVAATAYGPLVNLLRAAEEDQVALRVDSGYRSAGYQKRIFMRMLAEGRTFEDIVRYVAPPGYSQHMLGTAVDFFPSDWRFADTTAYAWLQENAGRFGFEETYPKSSPEKLRWEAWHWNFAGTRDADRVVSDLLPDRTKKKPEAEPEE